MLSLTQQHYLNFVPFVLLMNFVSQKHSIVNLFLYVIKLYNNIVVWSIIAS